MKTKKDQIKSVSPEKKETKSTLKDENAIIKAKDAVIKTLDQNGNGKIDIEDIIVLAIKTPGVHITRASFLKKELFKNYPQEVIDKAITTTPAQAGIPSDEIDKIADEVIRFERNCVSGISAALGAPGGWQWLQLYRLISFSITDTLSVQLKSYSTSMVSLKLILTKMDFNLIVKQLTK